jgi:hypothetical protein
MLSYYAVPILVGCSTGFAYGLSFIWQHKGLFGIKAIQNRAQMIAFFFIRIGLLLYAGNYMLQAPLIPSILGSMGFLIVFWLIIMQVKANLYERA